MKRYQPWITEKQKQQRMLEGEADRLLRQRSAQPKKNSRPPARQAGLFDGDGIVIRGEKYIDDGIVRTSPPWEE